MPNIVIYILYIYIYVYIHDFTLHLPESRPTIQRDHSASQNRTFLTLYAHTCWEDDTILPSRIWTRLFQRRKRQSVIEFVVFWTSVEGALIAASRHHSFDDGGWYRSASSSSNASAHVHGDWRRRTQHETICIKPSRGEMAWVDCQGGDIIN